MTVSYKKSGQDGAAYYTNCMSPDGSKSVDDYYTGSAKEPPGTWYVGPNEDGSRTTSLGIEDGLVFGQIESREDTERFHNLTNGFHPENGTKLVQNAGERGRVALHDFCLSAPKSVSAVWSQADTATKAAIEKAQESGAREFLDFMSSKSYSRQGKGGVVKAPAPLRAALFGHGSSREDDPQLHTHCVIFNVCERANGTTGALETLELMRWQGAAASLYHARLAWEVRQLEFGIERKENLFELAGVPDHVKEAFSQRRAQIVAAVERKLRDLGMDADASTASRGMFQAATLETRSGKDELTREELEAIWHERGAELGFTEVEVKELMVAGKPVELSDAELLEEARLALEELTENHAVFKEPALLTRVAVQLVGKASPDQILKVVETLKEKDLLTTETINKAGLMEQIFTTREMLILERQMLHMANRKDGKHVLAVVDLPDSLDAEQRAAAIAATSDINAVSVVEGTAGAGKTFTMAAISRAYEANGYTVTGLSGSWSAALNLQEAAKLADGRAITGWVNSVRKGTIELTEKSVIVVDEAGMVGSRDIKNVLELARKAGAKVILLGDTLQQKAIAAGDPLRLIAEQNGSSRLDVVRRQKDEKDRAAVLQFFAGQAAEGLAPYLRRGDVNIAEGAEDTHDQLIEAWKESRREHAGQSHLILATDKGSVATLNALAHQALRNAGLLGAGVTLRNMECTKAEDLVEFAIGDEVVFRITNNTEGVKNKDAGVIEAIERGQGDQGDTLYVRTNNGLVGVNTSDPAWEHKDGGLALQHAYACTTYSSQGLTVDRVFVKDSTALARDSAGVAMSRHRETCQVFVDRQARYEAKMRQLPADQWQPISKFTDEECLNQLKRGWSAERDKVSTLDYDEWRQAGALVDQKVEVLAATVADQAEDARILAMEEIERIRLGHLGKSTTLGDINPLKPLMFQLMPQYELKEPKVNAKAAELGVERLRTEISAAGVDEATDAAMREAGEAKFLTFDKDGVPVFAGRRPNDGKMVLAHMDRDTTHPGLRGRYPPILLGQDPSRVDIVRTGREAIELRATQLRLDRARSTIIVTGGRSDALALPHVRQQLEQAQLVTRYDTAKEDQSKVSKANAESAALAAEAAQRAEQERLQREQHRHR